MPISAARLHQRVEDVVLHLDRVMQLLAELADEIDPQRQEPGRADGETPRRSSQGKALLDRSVSATFASTSRERGPASTSTPCCVVTLSSRTLPSAGKSFSSVSKSCGSSAAGRDQVEALRPEPRQRELGPHAAALGQQIGQRRRGRRLRDPVGEDGVRASAPRPARRPRTWRRPTCPAGRRSRGRCGIPRRRSAK